MEPVDDVCNFDFLSEFQTMTDTLEVTSKRSTCNKCRRPVTVCWCSFLPAEKIQTASTVIVLQHPSEERQCLRTAPILVAALATSKCRVIRGRRFSPKKNDFEIASNDMILLYPGPKAVEVDRLPTVAEQNGRPYTIVLIDGTWAQARALYNGSPALHNIKQVRLNPPGCSEYVIKTQPSETCLSTVESAALALCVLEDRPTIREMLLRPLHALCDFQLKHGAVEHGSKAKQNADGVLRLKPRLVKRRLARTIVPFKSGDSQPQIISEASGT